LARLAQPEQREVRAAREQSPQSDGQGSSGERAPIGASELEALLRDGFERVLAEGLAQTGPLAAQLESSAAKTREKIVSSAGKLAEKYAALLAHRDQARVEDVRRLQLLLQPNGEPQERFYGLPYFAARYGERALIERVLAAIEPFAAAHRDLTL
jgi:hypothetical protein